MLSEVRNYFNTSLLKEQTRQECAVLDEGGLRERFEQVKRFSDSNEHLLMPTFMGCILTVGVIPGFNISPEYAVGLVGAFVGNGTLLIANRARINARLTVLEERIKVMEKEKIEKDPILYGRGITVDLLNSGIR